MWRSHWQIVQPSKTPNYQNISSACRLLGSPVALNSNHRTLPRSARIVRSPNEQRCNDFHPVSIYNTVFIAIESEWWVQYIGENLDSERCRFILVSEKGTTQKLLYIFQTSTLNSLNINLQFGNSVHTNIYLAPMIINRLHIEVTIINPHQPSRQSQLLYLPYFTTDITATHTFSHSFS